MTMLIQFLGTGDAMGVPRAYCDCKVCTEARNTGINRRLRSSVLLQDSESGSTLIDCGPDWGKQMEMSQQRNIDRVLITHAHFDHIGGLVEWSDACRWLSRKGQLFAPQAVIEEILARFPWLTAQLEMTAMDAGIVVGKWRVTPWQVNHGKNGYAYAFRFEQESTGLAWAYCSDSIGLSEQELLPMQSLDLLVLGTSFYEEPYPYETRSVYDVKEALQMLQGLAQPPKHTIFTHLSHNIDLRESYPLPVNTQFAITGLRCCLQA